MSLTIISLRVVHIVCGIFWVGTVIFNSLFLFPALATAGPAAGAVMAGLQRRKLMTFLPIAALLTIGSGATLFWIVSRGSFAAYSRSPVGATFGTAAVFATIGFIVGISMVRPAAMEASRLGRELAEAREGTDVEAIQRQMAGAQRRSTTGSAVMTVLLVIAAIGMASARYM